MRRAVRYGVLEYLFLCLRERQLRWFDLRANQELQPDQDDILRIRAFPGLWIQADAVLAKDYVRMMAALQQGLAAPEHAAFAERLATARSCGTTP